MKRYIVFSLFLLMTQLSFGQDIFTSARENNTTAIKQLIEQQVDLNQVNDRSFTPLIIAVYNNSQDVVKLLLEQGVELETQDAMGNTALIGAVFKNKVIVHKMVAYFYQADKDYGTRLLKATNVKLEDIKPYFEQK